MILQGRVSVNRRQAELGDSADTSLDIIRVDGKSLPAKPETICLMLYKPRGYVTTLSDEHGRKTAAELVDCGCRVYPIGRLDYASEGLLLFTNDGELANRLMHPKGGVEKVYEVTVTGRLEGALERLSQPIVLDGYKIKAPKVRLLRERENKAAFEVTIFEGRNRQIRRMCEVAELKVLRLCRVKEGSISLGKLPVGKWRYLTKEELENLRKEGKV